MTEKKYKTITVVLSIILAGLLTVIFFGKSGETNEFSAESVAEKMVSYINENLLGPETKASLINFSDEGSVYKLKLKIGEAEFDSFASKDGLFLFPEGISLEEGLDLGEPQTPPSQELPELSDIDPGELAKFVNCLKEAGFMVYGANWCGWTTRLVSMFGGWEIIDPIYVECTEEAELCQKKEIAGYPTILVNDQNYQGGRTFQDFSEVTNCSAPAGSDNQNTESLPTGGC